jgi:NADPH-dependent ferric siderophore reductase
MTMEIIDKLAKSMATRAMVIGKTKAAEHTYRLTIQPHGVQPFAYRPQDFLRILVGDDPKVSLRDRVRSYSIWNFDARTQSLDLAVCTFSDGPGAHWIKNVQEGDDVYFMKHASNLVIHQDDADAVMIGDISALGHLYGLRRFFRYRERVTGLIFGRDQADFFPDIDGATPFRFIAGGPHQDQSIISAVEAALPRHAGKKAVYVAGDGEMCALLYKHLKNAGWSGKQLKVKPFWMRGKRGLE